jgi:hypothetical protein
MSTEISNKLKTKIVIKKIKRGNNYLPNTTTRPFRVFRKNKALNLTYLISRV